MGEMNISFTFQSDFNVFGNTINMRTKEEDEKTIMTCVWQYWGGLLEMFSRLKESHEFALWLGLAAAALLTTGGGIYWFSTKGANDSGVTSRTDTQNFLHDFHQQGDANFTIERGSFECHGCCRDCDYIVMFRLNRIWTVKEFYECPICHLGMTPWTPPSRQPSGLFEGDSDEPVLGPTTATTMSGAEQPVNELPLTGQSAQDVSCGSTATTGSPKEPFDLDEIQLPHFDKHVVETQKLLSICIAERDHLSKKKLRKKLKQLDWPTLSAVFTGKHRVDVSDLRKPRKVCRVVTALLETGELWRPVLTA